MKTIFTFLMVAICLNAAQGQGYFRSLPDLQLQNAITPDKFPDMDAIILTKEQSTTLTYQDIYFYGTRLKVPNTSHTIVIIVKVLDDIAVHRYADVEFRYSERLGNLYPNSYFVRARVQKPDSTVIEMPSENVQNIAEVKSADNTPLVRKVVFKIPNVSLGDVIQYEYGYSDIFSYSTGGLFYYNDKDFILYSSLYITVPKSDSIRYFSFPENEIGHPKIVQQASLHGDEKTYFWSVANLRAYPSEPFPYPFEASAFLTAFVAGHEAEDSLQAWNNLSKSFFNDFIDKGHVAGGDFEILDLPKNGYNPDLGFKGVDSVYTHLRKYFVLSSYNSLYPLSSNVDGLFDSKRGDASDLSYLMFKIVEKWGIKENIVWIRDLRDGPFEPTVPTRTWFDRCGLLVTIDGEKKLYDFDRSVPSSYELPWFSHNINIVVVGEDSCYNMIVKEPAGRNLNLSYEKHDITFTKTNEIKDSLTIGFRGRPAQELRNLYYDDNLSDIENSVRSSVSGNHFSKVDSVWINDFLNQRDLRETVTGYEKAKLQSVDSFLIFKPDNIIMRHFRDEIFTTDRHNALYFGVPLQFLIHWGIKVPQGYLLLDTVANESPTNFHDCSANLNIYQIPDGIEIAAEVNILDVYFDSQSYKGFLDFLDRVMNRINKAVVFKKQ
ncbi:MAG TPA: DUF3857 domain-containing protein [Candidatus Kryptonia bacterium]